MRQLVLFSMLLVTSAVANAQWRIQPGEVEILDSAGFGKSGPKAIPPQAPVPEVVGSQVGAPQAVGPKIRGSFKLEAYAQGSPSMSGGACLLTRIPGRCTVDSDCQKKKPSTFPQGSYTYCATYHVAELQVRNTCWLRPGPAPEFCTQLPGGLEQNVKYFTPAVLARVAGSAANKPKWRVITCQNLVPMGCRKPGAVQGQDRVYRFGPVHTVP